MGEQFIIYGPKVYYKFSEISLGQQIYDGLLQNRNLPVAFTDATTEKNVSYNSVLEKSWKLAQSLNGHGIKQFDVIEICSENNVEYFCLVIAALYLGCIVTTLNPRYKSGELLHTMNLSKPTLIFCSEMTVGLLLEVKQHIKSIRKIIVIDTSENTYNGYESLEQFIANNLNMKAEIYNFKPIAADVNDVSFILYSSGTTGAPKGVMLTHKNITNLLSSYFSNPKYFKKLEPGTDVCLGLLPFFHTYGLCRILTALLIGRRIVVLKSFEPNKFLQCIQKYKITTISIVPPLANFLAKSPLVDNYDLSSLKLISCGAATLSKRNEERLNQRLKTEIIRQAYGLTEATTAVLAIPLGECQRGSCGKVLPNTSAKVVDIETRKILGPLQTGELCFKGDSIMKGYVEDNAATKKIIDQDGWLHTGDLGYYDENGFFFIVDRIKELIKYNSYQVAPAELESILLTNPKISDAGVVGLPDETAGELPLAFVVTATGHKLTEKEVQDFVADKVSPQKKLRGGVRFVNEIPKTPSGKILRRTLKTFLEIPTAKL